MVWPDRGVGDTTEVIETNKADKPILAIKNAVKVTRAYRPHIHPYCNLRLVL
jgi:hypothetical protein